MAELPVPVIRQNCLYVEEHASDLVELSPVCGQFAGDLAELPVPGIWMNCLSFDRSVPVIGLIIHNSFYTININSSYYLLIIINPIS